LLRLYCVVLQPRASLTPMPMNKLARMKRKYNIGRSEELEQVDESRDTTSELMRWNTVVQRGCTDIMTTGFITPGYNLPEEQMLRSWLWETDPVEPCPITTLLNASQLTGLLLARHYAQTNQVMLTSSKNVAEYLNDSSKEAGRLVLFDAPINELTLRELRDTVQNIQLQWVGSAAMRLENIKDTLDACFHRFGVLASCTFGGRIMNDQGSIEDSVDGLLRLNKICIRRFVNVFYILFRHIQFHKNSIYVNKTVIDSELTIGIHQILSASDDFGVISMNWDLMPAAKLNYIHDFPGMYNSISQVVYFHDPKYNRRMQERKKHDEYGKGTIEAVYMLPCIMQLYPEITLLYEEEAIPTAQDGKTTFHWILAGHTLYLISSNRKIYYHPNLIILLSVYLDTLKVTQVV
jgi:hypothetical protein